MTLTIGGEQKQVGNIEYNFTMFTKVYDIFKMENHSYIILH